MSSNFIFVNFKNAVILLETMENFLFEILELLLKRIKTKKNIPQFTVVF